ncbi:hypothetical protein N7468_009723 [Penicillium chermesinum]|uniref:Uncharacterized protein n=1 Tax=Penicillium chermesinum TaxID=63820 RepID=A0A9W9TFJ4_9EURO|nr:uncharacterized protein N7468_009723 [Penicillium chermesinum]KAJ5220519.1 hypothetical protein N7468_009723 [Penicillium chermesinum]KAJ6157950.1 hypothetical protein N7470_005542 [Penicillium chermesinum]
MRVEYIWALLIATTVAMPRGTIQQINSYLQRDTHFFRIHGSSEFHWYETRENHDAVRLISKWKMDWGLRLTSKQVLTD